MSDEKPVTIITPETLLVGLSPDHAGVMVLVDDELPSFFALRIPTAEAALELSDRIRQYAERLIAGSVPTASRQPDGQSVGFERERPQRLDS